jgi:excisionase family DNA binding protein
MSTRPTQERSFGVDTAARMLGVSPSTIWRLVRDEQIGSFKIRDRRLIPASEIERLLRGHALKAEQS